MLPQRKPPGWAVADLTYKREGKSVIAWLVNAARMCICKHKFEFLCRNQIFEDGNTDMPIRTVLVYRCTKCGFVQKVKL